ncbi:MAG: SH3 domain-containing protein [Pyrinomonadaceae bacterium]
MKQCPACKTSYTDDSLKFCLADGSVLDSAMDEQPTVIKPAGMNAMRVDIGSTAASTDAMPRIDPVPTSSSGTWVKIALGVVILGLFAIGAVGLIGAVFYYGTGDKEKDIVAKSPTPTPTATATPDAEKERLRDELANIQKKLDEQKKTSVNTNPDPIDDEEIGSSVTATVNSPNDGFLALRSIPDAELGDRISRIPHGTEIEINNCEKTQVTLAGRTGRWCQVEYNGTTGWVFDAWLEY